MTLIGIEDQVQRQIKSVAYDILMTIRLWFDRHHQRRQLRQLSNEQLCDIGLTRSAAQQEAEKPFWVD